MSADLHIRKHPASPVPALEPDPLPVLPDALDPAAPVEPLSVVED